MTEPSVRASDERTDERERLSAALVEAISRQGWTTWVSEGTRDAMLDTVIEWADERQAAVESRALRAEDELAALNEQHNFTTHALISKTGLVRDMNVECNELTAELAASRERERKLRETLERIDIDVPHEEHWQRMDDCMWAVIGSSAARIVRRALTASPSEGAAGSRSETTGTGAQDVSTVA